MYLAWKRYQQPQHLVCPANSGPRLLWLTADPKGHIRSKHTCQDCLEKMMSLYLACKQSCWGKRRPSFLPEELYSLNLCFTVRDKAMLDFLGSKLIPVSGFKYLTSAVSLGVAVNINKHTPWVITLVLLKSLQDWGVYNTPEINVFRLPLETAGNPMTANSMLTF